MAFPNPRNAACYLKKLCGTFARKRGERVALTVRDVRCDPIANRVLDLLMHDYTVAGERSGLVLTKNTGDLKLFINELDDLRQLDFIHHRAMVRHMERLRTQLTASNDHRERWKVRALMAEALALEATAKISNNGGRGNVVDTRYAALKRFLAKRFHPDYAPGGGIEKIVRNEIFKEIWNEIERLEGLCPIGEIAERLQVHRAESVKNRSQLIAGITEYGEACPIYHFQESFREIPLELS